jgi:hypothetical protein
MKWPRISIFLISCLIVVIALKCAVEGNGYLELLSNLNKFLTFSFLIFFSSFFYKNYEDRIVNLCIFILPISILVSALSKYNFIIIPGARTSSFGYIDRLFFPFHEPSHYAIVLALAALMALSSGRFFAFLFILAGLILTGSLSGWILLVSIFPIFMFQNRGRFGLGGMIMWLPLLVSLIAVLGWFVVQSPWLSFKINQVTGVFSGETGNSSVFVRFNSAFLWYYFIKESFFNNDFFLIVVGMGPVASGEWIREFYDISYDLEVLPSSFNAISSLVLNFGLFGLTFCFLLLHLFNKINRIRDGSVSFLVFFLVSLFHGYAFGSLSILYFVFILLCSKSISRKVQMVGADKNNKKFH